MSNDKKTKKNKDEKWLDDGQMSEVASVTSESKNLPEKESSMMAKFAFVFSLSAMAASGLLYLDLYQQKQSMDKQRKESVAKLDQMERLQIQQTEAVQQMLRKNPVQWLGAEVLYMLRIADRKLWLEHDTTTALSLVQETRSLISQVQDPNFVNVFNAITNDIQYIEKMNRADLKDAHQQLEGFEQKLEQLPIMIYSHMAEMKTQDTLPDDAPWQDKLAYQWRDLLQEVVSVRRHHTNNPIFLLPEQVWYLRENMRRQLLTAQLALYRQDGPAYQHSISLLTTWVKQYADLKQARAQDTLNELMNLEMLDVSTEQYQPLQSIAALEKALDKASSVTEEQAL